MPKRASPRTRAPPPTEQAAPSARAERPQSWYGDALHPASCGVPEPRACWGMDGAEHERFESRRHLAHARGACACLAGPSLHRPAVGRGPHRGFAGLRLPHRPADRPEGAPARRLREHPAPQPAEGPHGRAVRPARRDPFARRRGQQAHRRPDRWPAAGAQRHPLRHLPAREGAAREVCPVVSPADRPRRPARAREGAHPPRNPQRHGARRRR